MARFVAKFLGLPEERTAECEFRKEGGHGRNADYENFLPRAKTWSTKLLVWRNFGEREAQVADHGPNGRDFRSLARIEFPRINPFDGWTYL